ncbi:hypothetical protein HBIAX_05542 [Achromobacter xylosoxidans]|nr:hypothetical protein HBIAX_05542 [Achromobacter xylosoxidans]
MMAYAMWGLAALYGIALIGDALMARHRRNA